MVLTELAPTIYGQSGRGPVFRNYIGGEIGEMWGVETTGLVEMEHLSDVNYFWGFLCEDAWSWGGGDEAENFKQYVI